MMKLLQNHCSAACQAVKDHRIRRQDFPRDSASRTKSPAMRCNFSASAARARFN